jgi:F-type H+-transporting ATPase subunit gamma
MPSIKEYDVKLASLKNTRKMTKTMKMVSAGKLQKALISQRNARVYASKLTELVHRLAGAVDASSHPLLQQREKPENALVLLFTSDKGLCAGFNNNLIKFTENWVTGQKDKYTKLAMSFCGRRGLMYFKKRMLTQKVYEDVTQKPSFADAIGIGEELEKAFIHGGYDEVYLAHNTFISPLSQKPTLTKLLPFEPTEVEAQGPAFSLDYVFEPQQQQLMNELLPRILYFKIYYTLLENAAGEHGARMTAMDNATRNADDMVKRYTLLRNRARQAAITTELIEIISGAEAL